MKIGFKNFKKFKDFPMIELAPITFLVGPNNSGKSSFIKALTFLLYNCKKNYQTKYNDEVSHYRELIDTVTFHNDDLANYDWGDFTSSLHNYGHFNQNDYITFSCEDKNAYFEFGFGARIDDIKLHPSLAETLPVSQYSIRDTEKNIEVESNKLDSENFISKLRVERVFFIQWIKDTLNRLPEYKDWQQNHIQHPKYRSLDDNILYPIIQVCYSFRNLKNFFQETLLFLESIEEDEILIEINSESPINKVAGLFSMYFHKLMNPSFNAITLRDMIYIETHNATHKFALLKNDKNDFLTQTVSEFFTLPLNLKSNEIIRWINKWLHKFGIGTGFEISSHFNGEILSVDILEGDGSFGPMRKKIGTLGTGSIQIFILLLKIAVAMINAQESKLKSVIIVEEPEQNLHPKLQSKLADLFLDAYEKTNRRIQFVVETHSEYLIRRTQVMVAKEHYPDEETLEKENPFKVYFFPAKGLPYDMGYKISGRFIKKFDYGFFDEATKWYLKILYYEQGGV